MTSTGMWKREGHDGCLAQIAALRAENEALKGEVAAARGLETIFQRKLAAAEAALAALRGAASTLVEEAERTAETCEDEGLPKGWKLPHLRNAATALAALLNRVGP